MDSVFQSSSVKTLSAGGWVPPEHSSGSDCHASKQARIRRLERTMLSFRMAAADDVTTMRLIESTLSAELMTFSVPSRAGSMRSR